jgi:hypothetical protein
MFFNDLVNKGSGVKFSPMKESDNFNENRRCKSIITLRENVVNFEFLLHNLDHRTSGSCNKDGFLIIMSQLSPIM